MSSDMELVKTVIEIIVLPLLGLLYKAQRDQAAMLKEHFALLIAPLKERIEELSNDDHVAAVHRELNLIRNEVTMLKARCEARARGGCDAPVRLQDE